MKKVLLGISAVFVIAVLASPAVVGWVLERQLSKQVAIANERPGLSIEKQKYRRGWLKSNAEYQVTVERPEGNSVTIAAVDIHHGPLPVSVLWTDGLKFKPSILIVQGDVLLKQLAVTGIESPEQLSPLALQGIVNFSRKVEYQFSHPGGQLKFTRPNRASAVLDWQAGSSSGVVSAKSSDVSGVIEAAGFEFKDGSTDLQTGKLAMDFSFQKAKSAGHLNSRLDSLTGRLKYGDIVDSVSVSGVVIDSQLSALGDAADARVQATVATFSLRDFELNGGKVDVAVNGIPQIVVGEKGGQGGDVAPAPAAPPAPARLALSNAELLLNEVSGQLKQGRLNATGRADLRALSSNEPLALESVLKALRASADVVADEPLVGYALSNYAAPRIGNLWYASTEAERNALRQEIQNSQQLKLRQMLQTGWLKPEGERYRSVIDYADGQLTVNGSVISDSAGI